MYCAKKNTNAEWSKIEYFPDKYMTFFLKYIRLLSIMVDHDTNTATVFWGWNSTRKFANDVQITQDKLGYWIWLVIPYS